MRPLRDYLQKNFEKSAIEQIADDYWKGFKGIADFKKKGSDFVRKNGYILMCQYSGHKMFWWDHKEWLERQKSFTKEFWEDYGKNHKNRKKNEAFV